METQPQTSTGGDLLTQSHIGKEAALSTLSSQMEAGQTRSSRRVVPGAIRPRKIKCVRIYFRLLQLPTELRLEILKLLLWHPHPIHQKTVDGQLAVIDDKNYDFYPEILRVRRQIHGEGKDYLYENTVQISSWRHSHFKPNFLFLGKHFTSRIPGSKLLRFKRVQVMCHFQNSKSKIGSKESRAHRLTLQHLSVTLGEMQHLKEMEIVVRKGDRPFNRSKVKPVGEKFLAPLEMVYGAKIVRIAGVSDAYADTLRSTIVQIPSKVEHMVLMLESLEHVFATKTLCCDDYRLSLIYDLRNAVDEYDMDRFKVKRRTALREIYANIWEEFHNNDDDDRDSSRAIRDLFNAEGIEE